MEIKWYSQLLTFGLQNYVLHRCSKTGEILFFLLCESLYFYAHDMAMKFQKDRIKIVEKVPTGGGIALNSALIEIHIDNINMYLAKKVQKIVYVRFCNILNKIVKFEDIEKKITKF